MFATLSDRLNATLSSLRGRGVLTEADIERTTKEIRTALLEADVALPVVKAFVAQVKNRAAGQQVSRALNPSQQVVKIVNDELTTILGGETRTITFAKGRPTVIMLAGLQGAGKTTLAGKLAKWLASQGRKPLLVAADLQRPNAVNQLSIVGERVGAAVWAPEPGNGVGDPIEVARTGVALAVMDGYDTVIIDTAGRLGIDAALMRQAAEIRDAVKPDEVLFVVDAMIGQDAVKTATAFRHGVGFDGVVLTKMDGDARGGAALSIRTVTGRPIMFASTGEGMGDFEVFHPERMAGRILGMGDVLSLIEQAERAWDAKQAEEMARKLQTGESFGLDDFMSQLAMIRKMGSLKKIFGMLPGAGQMREAIDALDDREIDRVEAMVRSMTPAERKDPSIINGSRRARIARGSGVAVSEVAELVERFFAARDMMQMMARGGQMGLPGAPGVGTGKKAKGRQQAMQAQHQARRNKTSRSGNPAKRAAEAAQRAAGPVVPELPAAPASPFGPGAEAASPFARRSGVTGAGGPGLPPTNEIPEELRRLLRDK